MSWWDRLTGGKSGAGPKSQRLDYLSEAMALERQGDYDAALTSYRLALRDRPEDAIRCYKSALDVEPQLSGAHYGLAFLLMKKSDRNGAAHHLEAFLAQAPSGPEAERWVRHAEATLETLRRAEPVADESGQ
jgi:tetratricopeptide (TPR) repeat protein